MKRTIERTHGEHFSEVKLGGRKSCPNCKLKGAGLWYWWYEYHRSNKHTVKHFCVQCWVTEIRPRLVQHAKECGCKIELNWHGFGVRPVWLTLAATEEEVTVHAS